MAGPFPAQGSPHLSAAAGVDLSSNQFYVVKKSSGALVLCDTLGERPAGILLDAPVSGEGGAYARTPGYRVPAYVGAAGVTKGNEVAVDATGRVRDAASTHWVFGEATETATVGALTTIEITGLYIKA